MRGQDQETILKDLKEWGIGHGVKLHGWDVEYLPSYGTRGGVAHEDIEEGAVLVTVPLEAALTYSKTATCPFPPPFGDQRAWNDCPSWEYGLALRIIYEKHVGSNSKWNSFIAALPSSVPSLLHYTSEELAELQYPELAARAMAAQNEVRTEYERITKLLQVHVPSDAWIWAVDIARSRAFELPPQNTGRTSDSGHSGAKTYGIFPLCDMLNHKFGNTQIRVSSAGGAPVFEVLAGEAFAAGDQVASRESFTAEFTT